MKISSLLALSFASTACADQITDYWYRLCSPDLAKNEAVLAECPKKLKKKQSKCFMKSETYMRSLFACMEAAEGKSIRPKGMKAYKDSFEYVRQKMELEPGFTIEELMQMDKTDPITQSYKEANQTKSGPFLPLKKTVSQDNVNAQSMWTYHHIWAQTFGQITVYYVAGIVVLQTIFHFLSWVLPSLVRAISNNAAGRYLRRYCALPALFNKHRSTPVRLFRYIMLSFPPRLHVILLLGYLLLDIVGLAYNYPYYPGPATFKSKAIYIGQMLAYRSSGMVMYKLPLIYLFAGHNNFMIWLTGWQMEVFNHWHRWIARLSVIDVVIHAISYSISDHLRNKWEDRTSAGWWRVGIVATITMGLTLFQATKSSRAPAYETFLIVHILLAITTVVGTYYHVKTHTFGAYEIWAVVAIWGFDRVVRIARILFNGAINKATIRVLPGDVMEITANYTGFVKAQPGGYCFIHFAHPLFWFQSHPLSVVPVEGSPKTLKFVSKAQKGITRIMHDRALANGGTLETRIMIDGQYGVTWPSKQFKEVVTIAGGIGFTATYSHTISLLKQNPGQLVHLHWCISNRDPLAAFATEVENLLKYSDLRFTVHINSTVASIDDNSSEEEKEKEDGSSTTSSGRIEFNKVNFAPDFNKLIYNHISNSTGPICFFSCGPPAMADAVRDSVATNLLTSKNYVQFYEESFTM